VYDLNAMSPMAIKMPAITMVTSNSINVNPASSDAADARVSARS